MSTHLLSCAEAQLAAAAEDFAYEGSTTWRTGVPLHRERGVEVAVNPDGWLVLCDLRTEQEYFYPPPFTVAWIALQRWNGDPHLALDEIAEMWQEDASETLAAVQKWLEELREAQLVRDDGP
ncbi:hypothetical protein [Streptomyces nigra]|jgi:hypothetical protein|uniref:hypothetical protein n=1 Tax=Streptomyces nigra TaxID=1827580 RepID=UPI00342E7BB0